MSQQEIVSKYPSFFKAGTKKEGTFETKNLKELESVFPITINLDPKPPIFKHPRQSIFFITSWTNDIGQIHCVRINSIENNKVILMNPNYPGCTQELDKNVFTSWKKAPILIEINK